MSLPPEAAGSGLRHYALVEAARQILVVDDDSAIREAISEVLQEDGYSVVTAANGQEAMAQLSAARDQPPGLILLDLMMPVMDGWQFLDRYAEDDTLPPVPIIVISANLAASGGIHRRDVLLYLKKPLDIDRLLETVHTWCD